VDNEQAILSLRGDISDVKARLRIVETRVGRLRSAASHAGEHVEKISGEPEMGAPVRRAAKPVAKPKEKRLQGTVKPHVPVKPVETRKPGVPSEPRVLVKPPVPEEPEAITKAAAVPEADFGGIQPRAAKPEVSEEVIGPPPALPPEPAPWDALASRFLSNWTGVLGSIVLVAGIGFLGTYAALRMPPFARFALVLLASAALFFGYLSLRERERWDKMALWLRSSAAAVFLFACAAAGGLPNVGLMWIASTGPALAVLLVGVALNLALAWSVGRQGFATLHLVLALIPMAILPQAPMSLGIVTAISLFGVLLAQRQHWTYHLMATVLAYTLFHIFWLSKQAFTVPLPDKLAFLATGSAVVVYLGSALTNYRRVYATAEQEPDTMLTHLISWGLLAAALLMHMRQIDLFGTAVLGPMLLASGLVAYGLSVNARRRKISWLRDADVLLAQAFVLASLLTWRTALGPPVLFTALIFLETLLFLRLVIKDGVRPAVLVGACAAVAGAVMFMLSGVWTLAEDFASSFGTWQLAALMFAGACVMTSSGAYFHRYYREALDSVAGSGSLRVVGPLTALMALVGFGCLYAEAPFGLIALSVGAALQLGAHRLRGLGLVSAVWVTMGAAHLIAWFMSFGAYAAEPVQQLMQLAPAAVLATLVIWRTPGEVSPDVNRPAAIYLLGINVGISTYLLLSPVSALLPTVVWLSMSLIALETARQIRKTETALPVLHLAYGYVFAAAAGYATVVLPTLTYLYSINLRLLMEVFGMGALIYWWLSRPSEALGGTSSWRSIHPYFLELTLALLTTTVFIEAPLVWRPVVWMAIAFLFLSAPLAGRTPRFLFYSLLAFVTSIVAVSVNISTAAVPSPNWYQQPWNTGLVAIAIQGAYLFAAYQRLELEKVTFQPGLKGIENLSRVLAMNRAATICYPFFAGVALFLAWRFEQALLTFLWASETFAIFVLSIVLRQNHFRLVALGGLALCLLRLVVYDMQEADLFVRGLVFVGVGGLMLAMNAVYNKYGARVAEA
jgi:hypothetical protein